MNAPLCSSLSFFCCYKERLLHNGAFTIVPTLKSVAFTVGDILAIRMSGIATMAVVCSQ